MKVGIVLITHARIGVELIHAAEFILKEPLNFIPISVLNSDEAPYYQKQLKECLAKAEEGKGVLLLSDMFGGTPANLCLPFLKEGKVELMTGVNLPMLLKLSTLRNTLTLAELVETLKMYGQRHVSRALDILKTKNCS